MRLENRVAVVTGAASGLGRATAVKLGAEGATVVLMDHNGAALQEVDKTSRGQMLAFAVDVAVDVADEESVDRAFVEICARLGHVHVLVNAAGIAAAGKVVSRGNALPWPASGRLSRST